LEKKTFQSKEKNQEKVQLLRGEYGHKIRNLDEKDLIFIDESGVNLAMTKLKGRALKGERVRDLVPLDRGKNVSLIGALCLDKILALSNIYGSVDGVTFEAFIVKELIPKLWNGACIVMDNARIHLGEMVREKIEEAGAS